MPSSAQGLFADYANAAQPAGVCLPETHVPKPPGQTRGGGAMSLHPGPGAAWGKFLSQELFGKQMGGGKGGRQNGESKSMVRVCGSVGA